MAHKFISKVVKLLPILVIVNCTDYLEDAEKLSIERKKEERSKEVRNLLAGEIVFRHGETSAIKKAQAKYGGSGSKPGMTNVNNIAPKWSPDGSYLVDLKINGSLADWY